MNCQIIYEKVKETRAQNFITNCYNLSVIDYADKVWEHRNNLIFSYNDHGINRLIYFVDSWESLDAQLDEIDSGKYFLEFMAKEQNIYAPKNSSIIARMMRLSNIDCRSVFGKDSNVLQFIDTRCGTQAQEADIPEINQLLWATFKTEISHLLFDNELKQKLDQITIHKTAGKIDTILQADVMPKKFYINQVVNKGEKKNIHAILLNRLRDYVNNGGKYLYAWVEENNIASLKFHEKYGMNHDGMWSMIYSIVR